MIELLSIRNNHKYELIVKGSKFISLVYRVYSTTEVKEIINRVKIEYPSATHYCYGYVIDSDIKSSDDREPSKTAGLPILNQILGNNLNYTLIIVVRYFGGTKLGTGLLTRTYAEVAREVINKDNIISLVKGYDITISFEYNNIKAIDYILSNSIIINKVFDNIITYNVLVTRDILDRLSNYNVIINKEVFIEEDNN